MNSKKVLPRVTIRPAHITDMEEILNIDRNVYSGIDILPIIYPWMLHAKNNYPFLLEINGEVAAFTNYHVMNNGKSIVSMSSRTSSKYRGLGLMDKLKSSAGHTVKSMYPRLSDEIYVTLGCQGSDRHLARMRQKITVLYQWNTIFFKADLDSLENAVLNLEPYASEIQDLSTPRALDLVNNGRMALLLRSMSDWLVYSVGWIPTRVTQYNLTQVVKHCHVRGTFQDGEMQSISFSSSAQAIIAPLHVLHITGGNTHICFGHVREFLGDAIKTSPPDSTKCIILTIHFSQNIDVVAVRDQLSQYFGDNLHLRGDRTDGILVMKSLL